MLTLCVTDVGALHIPPLRRVGWFAGPTMVWWCLSVLDVLLHASCDYTELIINGCLREHAIGVAPIHTFTTLAAEYIRGNHNGKRCLTSLIKILNCFQISSFRRLVWQVYLNQPGEAHLPLPMAEAPHSSASPSPSTPARPDKYHLAALKTHSKKN